MDTNQIAQQYVSWFESDPYDIGHTTKMAMAEFAKLSGKANQAKNGKINAASVEKVSKSLSNGSMMRVAPLAVWASELYGKDKRPNSTDFKKVIVADVTFTHVQAAVKEAVFIQSAMIAYLVQHSDSEGRAGDAVKLVTSLANDFKVR